jgi:cell division protease FtsH
MDGIHSNNGVITVATSNHPENMDWALVARPGRFDVRIDYPFPDHELLHGILELKLSRYPYEKDLDLRSLVKKMPHGFTGSHIQDIVNQANYISLGQTDGDVSSVKITQGSLMRSFDRTLYNFEKFLAERPHLSLGESEKKRDNYFS